MTLSYRRDNSFATRPYNLAFRVRVGVGVGVGVGVRVRVRVRVEPSCFTAASTILTVTSLAHC